MVSPLPARPRWLGAGPALAALGVSYAVFSFLLQRAGASARAVWLPIAPESYYGAQALFVAPLFVGLAAIFTLVTRAVAAPRQEVSFRDAFESLAPAYAWPILLAFVLPDLVAFHVVGFAGLGKAMRLYAPLMPVLVMIATTIRARALFGVSQVRAFAATFAGLVAQGVVGASVLR